MVSLEGGFAAVGLSQETLQGMSWGPGRASLESNKANLEGTLCRVSLSSREGEGEVYRKHKVASTATTGWSLAALSFLFVIVRSELS